MVHLDFPQCLTTAQTRASRHRESTKAANDSRRRKIASSISPPGETLEEKERLAFSFPKRLHARGSCVPRGRLVSASEAPTSRRARPRARRTAHLAGGRNASRCPERSARPQRSAASLRAEHSRPDDARSSRSRHEQNSSSPWSCARVSTRDARARALVPRVDGISTRSARARSRRARVRRRVLRGEPARGGPTAGGPSRLAVGGGRHAGHAGRALGRPAGKPRERRRRRAPRGRRRGVRGAGLRGAVPASGAPREPRKRDEDFRKRIALRDEFRSGARRRRGGARARTDAGCFFIVTERLPSVSRSAIFWMSPAPHSAPAGMYRPRPVGRAASARILASTSASANAVGEPTM